MFTNARMRLVIVALLVVARAQQLKNFSTTTLSVSLYEDSLNIARIGPVDGDFNFAAARDAAPFMYQLGDVSVRARVTVGDGSQLNGTWSTSTTAARAAAVVPLPATPGVIASADLTTALAAGGLHGLGLNVTQSYRIDTGSGDVLLTYELRNTGAVPLEVGGITIIDVGPCDADGQIDSHRASCEPLAAPYGLD